MSQSIVEIENTGVRGQGVAKSPEGRVFFVPGALPGDRVLVEYDASGNRFTDATLVQLLEPSVDRRPPACKYFGECGGCDWLNWSYEAQLQAKQKTLQHTLNRADLVPEAILPFLPAPQVEGFRTRIQVRQSSDKLGFYKKGSHEIVDIDSCTVAHPMINKALGELRKKEAKVDRKIELALGEDGEHVQHVVDAAHGQEGFTQGNAVQNQVLRSLVQARMQAAGAARVLELYCGDGNLSFAYGADVEGLLGIDGNRPAITKATERARANGDDAKLRFFPATVSAKLASQLARKFEMSYDTLLVDPPRNGMGGSLKAFLFDTTRTLIYVSCSPVAFSKDVRGLQDLGFTLKSVQGIDMFPHTHHIEFVAYFSRSF